MEQITKQAAHSEIVRMPEPKALEKQIFRLNLLTSFPISDDTVRAYADTIRKLDSRITPKIVELIIDEAVLENIELDVSDGVRCIFAGLEQLKYFKTNVVGDAYGWTGVTKEKLPFYHVMERFPAEIEKMSANDLVKDKFVN